MLIMPAEPVLNVGTWYRRYTRQGSHLRDRMFALRAVLEMLEGTLSANSAALLGLFGDLRAASILLRLLARYLKSARWQLRGPRTHPELADRSDGLCSLFSKDVLRLRGCLSSLMGLAEREAPYWDRGYAEALCRRFGLHPSKRMEHSSVEERALSATILVLGQHPEVLLIDTASLKLPRYAQRLIQDELLAAMGNEEAAVVFSASDLEETEQADVVAVFEEGELVLLEPGDKVPVEVAGL